MKTTLRSTRNLYRVDLDGLTVITYTGFDGEPRETTIDRLTVRESIAYEPANDGDDIDVEVHRSAIPHRSGSGNPVRNLVPDSQEVIYELARQALAEASPTKFVAGWNQPGYLPDNAVSFDNRLDAVAWLRDEIEHAYQHDDAPDNDGAHWQRWGDFQHEVNASNNPADWGTDPNGYAYFVEVATE